MPSDFHRPVLGQEAIESLDIKPDAVCVDMTLGRAGDSLPMMLKANKGHLYAIDKDQTALDYSQQALAEAGSNFTLYHGSFSAMTDLLEKDGVKEADAILFDIGVSSPQFDNPERGFSYRFDGPLDMRMDQSQELTAAIVVNTYSEAELRRIISEYGEDPSAYKIAHAIVLARQQKKLERTLELEKVIHDCLPSFVLNKKGNPAKQTFQALRYEVNGELEELKNGLNKALKFLSLNGRLAIITFNSLEDRTVKDLFRSLTSYPAQDRHLPPLIDQEPLSYALVNKKPIVPSEEELEINPRARSAKLRVIERIRK